MAHGLTHILNMVHNQPWAILPAKLDVIVAMLQRRLEGSMTAEDLEAVTQPPRLPQTSGDIAVLPVFGTIAPRMNLVTQASGGTSVEMLTAQFRAAMNDDRVGSIVLDIDSPGGDVAGVTELANEIRATSGKPVVAVANHLAASAAFWIASAADEIVASPSAQVGNIGVIATHTDTSARDEAQGVKTTLVSAGKGKADGAGSQPLSDNARADLQAKVDTFFDMFVTDVVKGRNAAGQRFTGNTVREKIGAKVFTSNEALSAGLIDRIETLDGTIGRLSASGQHNRRRRRRMRGEVEAEMVAVYRNEEKAEPIDSVNGLRDAVDTWTSRVDQIVGAADEQDRRKSEKSASLRRRRRRLEAGV